MPRIELINVPLYQPSDPYHWTIDNIPLKSLMERQELINLALDDIIEQIRDAVGTQNTVANRLNQSIEADGSLKTSAIDDALHSIESHADSDTYVRMKKTESAKLELIESEATDVALDMQNGSTTVLFDSGVVKFRDSSTVTIDVDDPNIVSFHMAFTEEAAHKHYYNQIPVHAVGESPDFINYKVNSTSSAFVEGSLRIFVNGVRINPVASDATDDEIAEAEILVPGALVDDPWTSIYFVPNPTEGTFSLSAAISDDDIIFIDYDISLT